MRRETLVRLGAILALLLLLTAATALLTRPSPPPPFAPATLADDAIRLELEGPGGKLALAREKSGWTASEWRGYPADGTLIREVLDKLAKSTVSDPVTEDAGRYELFGVGASSTTRLRLSTAKASPVLDFYVGKDGPDYPSAFVRVAGGPAVAQVSGVAAFELSRPPGEWLDKKVTPGPASSVTRVAVRGPKGSWELTSASGTWTLGGAKLPADRAEAVVKPLREAAGALEAESLGQASAAAKDAGLDRPELHVQVDGSFGRVAFTVAAKKDAGGRHWVRKEKEDRVLYLVADYKLAALRKSAAELLKK